MAHTTRNSAELAHFQAHSAGWWEDDGPFRVLHEITPLRMAFLKEKVGVHFRIPEGTSLPLKGLRILDVGCGGGILCEPLARLGAEVTGIDPVAENIQIAEAHSKEAGLQITYLACAVEDLLPETPPFDLVVASEIIEHVDHPDAFLKMCAGHVRPHGAMVVTTFNKTLKSYLLGIVAAEYILRWAPRGTHAWEKFITPQELSQKLTALGLDHQEMTGLSFSPLTRTWNFSPSLDVNYFLWAGKR